ARGDTLFYVRDNGIGIETRHKDRIFAIFKRLHSADAFGGGSGAGLTIARKMVQQHGGLIWFDSQVGEGTTFYFTLPDAGSSRESAHVA
ncbi:MAG: sensor histidine kinase, partial [Rhizobacter sp.]